MVETWKPIPEYEDKYEASNLGNIRSISRYVNTAGNGKRYVKGRILNQQINHRGYSIIALSTGSSQKTYTVHQLVYSTFMPNFVKGTELNHKDGNKQNNALYNLEESNSSHNQLHAVRTGLRPKQGKSRFNNVTFIKNPRAKKKWAASIRYAGKTSYGWKTFDTEEEAAKYVDELLDSIGDTERNRNFP